MFEFGHTFDDGASFAVRKIGGFQVIDDHILITWPTRCGTLFVVPLKLVGRHPDGISKNLAHNISYEKENCEYLRFQAEIMCEMTTLCKLEPLPTEAVD